MHVGCMWGPCEKHGGKVLRGRADMHVGCMWGTCEKHGRKVLRGRAEMHVGYMWGTCERQGRKVLRQGRHACGMLGGRTHDKHVRSECEMCTHYGHEISER
jgi:hypothetical protein